MADLRLDHEELCRVQGDLFVKSVMYSYNSEEFVNKFMNSRVAEDLDSLYCHLQWAGEGYIHEALVDEVGSLNKSNDLTNEQVMYWIGYVYRYWHYYTGESSKEIYKIANFNKMCEVWLGYHTLSVEMAIDRLKEAYKLKKG